MFRMCRGAAKYVSGLSNVGQPVLCLLHIFALEDGFKLAVSADAVNDKGDSPVHRPFLPVEIASAGNPGSTLKGHIDENPVNVENSVRQEIKNEPVPPSEQSSAITVCYVLFFGSAP